MSPGLAFGFFGLFGNKDPEKEPLREAPTFQATDVQNYETSRLRFQCLRDWLVAEDAPDHDPAGHITIGSSGDSYVTIELFDPAEEPNFDDLLERIRLQFDGRVVDTETRLVFDRWGAASGTGTHLIGKIMRAFPGGCRIFVGTFDGVGVMVTEYYYDEEKATAMDGFALIAHSFELVEYAPTTGP
ncbi:MAG: hypothetical protein ACFB21_05460 [Opitutales bacterium]